MKLNKETLKRIIKEEIESIMDESLNMDATPYELGYDAGKMNRVADMRMVDNIDAKVREDYMRGYNDGLAAGKHPPLKQ